MDTHETVRPMTSGQRNDIIATMMGAIPDLSFDEAQHGIIGDKGSFVVDIRAVFERQRNRMANIFPITCKGGKASELVARGIYADATALVPSMEYIDKLVSGVRGSKYWIIKLLDELFPIKTHAPISRTIKPISFSGRRMTSEGVLAEFVHCGLERPTYEEALTFGIMYPEEQRKCPIIFLHEPVEIPQAKNDAGNYGVLVLSRNRENGRVVSLRQFCFPWGADLVFAAVCKQ